MSTSDNDYLGYGVYADSLWKRIQSALDKDSGGKPLGDDPLVVGLFGEWGAGKSKLLSLIQDRAQLSANTLAERRKQDGGNFTLLVPVFFQPWKYEHEKHLHVPLMLHILEALTEQIELAQTWTEWAGGNIPQAIKEHLGLVVNVVKTLAAATALAVGVAVPLASAASFASAGLLAGFLKKSKSKEHEPLLDTFKHLDNGRFFYEMHEVLRAITRPTPQQKYLTGAQLNTNVSINFVIFIDDLDRCLPENAVGTLELIKTIFNVESFAFVLALDDEVIERGIGHRYKEYALENKKPEMPITGFEYLEKIVHVPFRLPALTAEQAALFVRSYELSIESVQRKRWFDAPMQPDSSSDTATVNDALARKIFGELQIDLWPLVRTCFDAYVPRKMIRLIELLHQTAAIALVRGKPLTLAPLEKFDIRVVLALILIQLFQPELYRLMRRRVDMFPFLLAAFSNKQLASAHVSDIDLLQWAVNPVDPNTKAPTYDEAIKLIAELPINLRADAQQVRMPLVVQLIEHRAVQRHVFDVLKLLSALAQNMGESAKSLTLAPYFSLLGQEEVTTHMPSGSQAVDTRPRFTVLDVPRLLGDWTSDDEAVVANIISRNEIPSNYVLASESALALCRMAEKENAGAKKILNGLQYLAPYIAKDDSEKFWNLVKDLNPIPTEVNAPTPDPKLAAVYTDVRSLLWQDKRFEPTRFYLLKDRFKEDKNKNEAEPIAGFVRIIGDRSHETFYMARTLTTVDQYKCFMDAGLDKTLWDKQGLAWLDGDDSAFEGDALKKHLASRETADRQQPAFWSEQIAFGSRPVMHVNWFQARAYARWLTKQLVARDDLKDINLGKDFQVLLPTETQWAQAIEQGARQASQNKIFKLEDYPWGNDGVNAKLFANIQGSEIGHASSVGCFAPTPLGLLDMVGNLWEWQDNLRDKAGKAVEMSKIERIDNKTKVEMDGLDLVALRGGSWLDESADVRCSTRFRSHPADWLYLVGFRVVLSLAN